MSSIHYTQCPVCSSTSIDPMMKVTDHSVSGEEFVVWQCRSCTLRFTQDVPDEASIGRYYQSADYISHSDTDKGLVNKMYRRVRAFTLGRKADLVISKTKSNGRLLDVGAGIGAFVHTMQSRGWQATGVEPDAGAREQALRLFNIRLQDAGYIEQLRGQQFDAITLWHVLEHVHDLHGYMNQLRSILAPGGRLFIAVPNYDSVDAAIYKSRWAAYDVPRHLYHFTPRSMAALLEQHGFKIAQKKPMWFDSFYISLLSSRYRHGSPSWIGAAMSGLRSNITALFNTDRCSSVIYITAPV
ncbi:MAG TPA: class I SAM-dependent methyltransferase [Flavisolibacter sp.]